MRKVFWGLMVCGLVLFSVSLTLANLNQFEGKWVNADSDTRGVTKLDIAVNGTNVSVQAWGKCQPSDCDWGRVEAYAYGPNVQSNLAETAQAISATYKTNFSQTLLIIHQTGGNRLQVEVLTRFTDGSSRSNYHSIYNFQRGLQVLQPKVEKFPKISSLATPKQLTPPDGKVINRFPRTTTLRWEEVSGAASYTVEIDCFQCCKPNAWCTDVGQTYKVVPNLEDTSYTFDFVGAQPGRWRVWAVGANGQESPKSGWWEFRYTR